MPYRSIDTCHASLHDTIAERILKWAVSGIGSGRLSIETPGGGKLEISGEQPGENAQLRIHSWTFLARIALGRDIGFAESFLAGDWSTPDLPALLRFLSCNAKAFGTSGSMFIPPALRRIRHSMNRNTRRGSRRNIAAHYDLGNAFYSQWLDPGMMYSSGLYTEDRTSLIEAQQNKLDRVAALLNLSGGERVLEIGCGWGGLAEMLAERHGCTVTGLTLSSEQLAYACDRLARSPVQGQCEFRLQDYRDVVGTYDRIVSVEMLEAVGEAYWHVYFEKLRSCLRPGGTAVLQVITIGEHHFEDYRRRPDFIQRYIFPGGMLPTAERITTHAEATGLCLVESECFGDSYARTLSDWRANFRQAWPAIRMMGFDERFRRMWDYYLAYCQSGFETGVIDVGLYKIVRSQNIG